MERCRRISRSVRSTRVLIDEGFDRQDLQPLPDSSVTGSSSTGKAKMCWEEEVQQNGGMDELLAVLGYQVRASDMAEVVQKLELLENLMGNAQGDGLFLISPLRLSITTLLILMPERV